MRAAFLSVLLSAPVVGQGAVWTVDDDGAADFDSIQLAVDAASDGDTILVQPGTYGGFLADGRTLAIVGTGDELSVVEDASVVRGVPSGGWFVLAGLEFDHVPVCCTAMFAALGVFDSPGPIRIEGCSFSRDRFIMLRIGSCAGVDLTRCTVAEAEEGAPFVGLLTATGVEVTDSNVAIHESSISSTLNLTGISTNPTVGSLVGGAGLVVRGSSLVYLSDSTLFGGSGFDAVVVSQFPPIGPLVCFQGPTDGGAALLLGEGDPVVFLRDVVLVPGPGGEGDELCEDGDSSPGSEVEVVSGSLVSATAPPRGLSSNSPVRAGLDDIELTFTGQPGDLAISLATTLPHHQFVPPFQATLLVDPLAAASFLGVVPRGGSLEVRTPTAPLPAGWGAVVLFLQGVAFDAGLGGHVGSPAVLVVTSGS